MSGRIAFGVDMMMLSRASCARKLVCLELAIVIAMVGCKGGDATSPPAPPPPPPVDQWNLVSGRTWTMQAQTEGYVCYGVHLTSDQYISGFRLVSPSSVQNEVMLTLSDSPVTEGSFACGPGSLGAHLIYAASLGTTPIEFPDGFGVHASSGQYLLLNIHLVNTTDVDATDSTRIEGRVDSAADVTTPIDMMLLGTFLINIPSDGQDHTATGACNTIEDQHLLAFLPLMRSRAVHQKVWYETDSGTQTMYDEDFDVQHTTYFQPSTPIAIPTAHRIDTRCSYINNTGGTETYGESSANESCFSAVYHYPVSTTANLFACASGMSFDIARR